MSLPRAAPLQWRFQYDANGNRTHTTGPDGADTRDDYDSLARVIRRTQPSPDPGDAHPVIGIAYDLQDRVAPVVDPRRLATGCTIDGLGNETLTQSPDAGPAQRTFFDNGSLHTAIDARGRQTTFGYDGLGRVTSISYASGTPSMFFCSSTARGRSARAA